MTMTLGQLIMLTRCKPFDRGFYNIPKTNGKYQINANGQIVAHEFFTQNTYNVPSVDGWVEIDFGYNPVKVKIASLMQLTFKTPYGSFTDYIDQSVLFLDGDVTNYTPTNLIWKFDKPVELEGFRIIPSFTRYMINRKGEIYNRVQARYQSPFLSKVGYWMVGLTPDVGSRRCFYIHRLLGFTFLDYPVNVDRLDINHIDGVKVNNAIENLEWVTRTENNIHACKNDLKADNKPILVKDVTTGIVTEYYSHSECGRQLGMLPKTIDWRVKSDGQKVFSDGLMFKHKTSQSAWSVITTPDLNGVPKSTIVYYKDKQLSVTYGSVTLAAKALGIQSGTLSYRLRNGMYENDQMVVTKS